LYTLSTNRYHKREGNKIKKIINEYADPIVTSSIGHYLELLVSEGFSRFGYKTLGRTINKLDGKEWKDTKHNLDFIFEKEGVRYGVEVKNTLGYMERNEIDVKVKMCRHLEINPVFVCRFLPKNWLFDKIIKYGGFALILKYQLYPPILRELVNKMRGELDLPVDCPKALEDGTIIRFEKNYHKRKLK